MRPIKLKIKGLNSFIEEQTIDFEKLTQQGLFGIFGPTGSGKTTILDGITLALYGEVSRKSNTFINANCDSCHVSFEFMIHGKEEKRYRVTRTFKRDKASGNSRSGDALLIDLTSGEQEILQDKITLVSKACEAVIGLGIEDFTRTVVLPQGKFSEFLKLEGKARRDMLERLFHLERYGDELSNNMSKKVSQVKLENSVLLGELKGYEHISEEQCKIQEDELKETKQVYQELSEKQQLLLAKMKEEEIIMKQQTQLEKVQTEFNELMKKADEIKEMQAIIQKGDAAKRIMPTLLSYEQLQVERARTQEKMSVLSVRFKELKTNKEELLLQGKVVNQIRELEYPIFMSKHSQLEDALAEEIVIEQLKKEMNQLVISNENNEQLKMKQETQLQSIQENLKQLSEQITSYEAQSEALQIDEKERENVQAGWMLSESMSKISKSEIDLKAKQMRFTEEKQAFQKELNSLETRIPSLQQAVSECQLKINELQNQMPNGDDLLKKNLHVQEAHEVLTKASHLQSAIEMLTNENAEIAQRKLLLDEEWLVLEEQILKHKQMLDHRKVEQLASQLRRDLQENEPCPVCGSIHHELTHGKGELSINEQESDISGALDQKKNELAKEVQQTTSRLFANEALLKSKMEELKELPNFDKQMLKQQETQLYALMLKKAEGENMLKEVEGIFQTKQIELNQGLILQGQMQTNLANSMKHLVDISKELEANQYELRVMDAEYRQLKNVFGVSDFKERNEQIKGIDAKSKQLLEALRRDREVVKEKQAFLDSQQKSYHETLNQLNLDTNTIAYKTELIESKQRAICVKFPQVDNIKEEIEKTKQQLMMWQQLFKEHHAKTEQVEQDYTFVNDELIAISTNVQQLTSRVLEESQRLEEMLRFEGFLSVGDLKEHNVADDLLMAQKCKVDNHLELLTKSEALLQHLTTELNGQHVSEETWQSDCALKQSNETTLTSLHETMIKQEQAIFLLKERLIEMGDLMVKKQAVEHKIALLNDLEKLFKGKKFVEFAALSQLRYVSYGADQRLKSITNGNYGIEIDENGRFMIRDYKNGGVARETATLSGGETFLASLSLALSLSAQIQLKGSAPLELFFLDEGFGTLDEHYLDIVMDSLEKIHNDHLKIGLITHVESIKNRMPMKLMIEPAIAGEGGSKVHIERL